MRKTYDLHVVETRPLLSPAFIHNELPITQQAANLVTQTRKQIRLNPRVMVDCSHGNAGKDYTQQPLVLQSITDQVMAGSPYLMGVMIESHLLAGKQKAPQDLTQLIYGQSITDACVDFATTTEMLRTLAKGVACSRSRHVAAIQS